MAVVSAYTPFLLFPADEDVGEHVLIVQPWENIETPKHLRREGYVSIGINLHKLRSRLL